MRRIYLARVEREHRTPWADVGRADVGIKFRRNGRKKERHGMPHNERYGKPDSIGDKRRKKKPAYLVGKQAGISTHRVIGLSRGRKENYILYFIIVHIRPSHFIISNHYIIHDITTFAQ